MAFDVGPGAFQRNLAYFFARNRGEALEDEQPVEEVIRDRFDDLADQMEQVINHLQTQKRGFCKSSMR